MSYDFLKAYMESAAPFDDARLVQEAITVATKDGVQLGPIRLHVHRMSSYERSTNFGTSYDVGIDAYVEFPNGIRVSDTPTIVLQSDRIGLDLRMYVRKFVESAIVNIVTSKRLQEIAQKHKYMLAFADVFDAIRSNWLLTPDGKIQQDLAARYFKFYVNLAKKKPDQGAFYRIREVLEELCDTDTQPRYFSMVYEEEDAVLVSYDHTKYMAVYDKKKQKIVEGDPDFIERFRLAWKLRRN